MRNPNPRIPWCLRARFSIRSLGLADSANVNLKLFILSRWRGLQSPLFWPPWCRIIYIQPVPASLSQYRPRNTPAHIYTDAIWKCHQVCVWSERAAQEYTSTASPIEIAYNETGAYAYANALHPSYSGTIWSHQKRV